MSFEQALKELETIVDRLEKGDVELEASILIYERGEALKTHCDGLLRKAEARVEKIALNAERRAHRHRASRRRGLAFNSSLLVASRPCALRNMTRISWAA